MLKKYMEMYLITLSKCVIVSFPTMAVYRTTGTTAGPLELKYAYDYRSYGEKINLTEGTDKVTENFTGKELDDETKLSYHEARFFDPILGIWLSIDLNRYFPSPYVYMGNGYNYKWCVF